MSDNKPLSASTSGIKGNKQNEKLKIEPSQHSPIPSTSKQFESEASTSEDASNTKPSTSFTPDDSASTAVSGEDSDSDKDSTDSPGEEFQGYAGISSDSIYIYAEQSSYENLTEEMCNMLAEDINYKLRYIIYHSLLKAKLQGRDVIISDDIDETFAEQQVDRIYGATITPNWIPFSDNNLYFLDDQQVNLIELAEKEEQFSQEVTPMITQIWLRDDDETRSDSEDNKIDELPDIFSEYFEISCNAIISNDTDIRNTALLDISENPSVGPIIDWFYNFSYLLLTKDVTYDSLTLRALKLLEVLENSPLPHQNVNAKRIKLLVKILLQRLLRFPTTNGMLTPTLRPMCYVLSLLCLRNSIQNMVMEKIERKPITEEIVLPFVTIIYFLGFEAVRSLFLPNIDYFLSRVVEENQSSLTEIILTIFWVICKCNLNTEHIYYSYREVYGAAIIPCLLPKLNISSTNSKQYLGNEFWSNTDHKRKKFKPNFTQMKTNSMKRRRKIIVKQQPITTISIENVFELPSHDCLLKRNLDQFRNKDLFKSIKNNYVVVGKLNFLLPLFKSHRKMSCIDHSILIYNI